MQWNDLHFHLAAMPSVPRSLRDPKTTNRANVNGTLNVLCAAKKPVLQRLCTLPLLRYMETYRRFRLKKACFRLRCHRTLLQSLPVNITVPVLLPLMAYQLFVCVILTYRPRQNPKLKNPAVIPGFIESIKQGKPPVIWQRSSNTRLYVCKRRCKCQYPCR